MKVWGPDMVTQMADGTVVAAYHEWSEGEQPLQYVLCTRFTLVD